MLRIGMSLTSKNTPKLEVVIGKKDGEKSVCKAYLEERKLQKLKEISANAEF